MGRSTLLCDRIMRLFLEKMHLDIPSVDTDLFENSALDSLAFVELVLHLEREFAIKVSLENLELDHFRSISRIADLVEGNSPPELVPQRKGTRNWVA